MPLKQVEEENVRRRIIKFKETVHCSDTLGVVSEVF